ncbi:MAG: HlyD family efflux transporter periplasmic adaptor subunit [Bacteroidia bacterium]
MENKISHNGHSPEYAQLELYSEEVQEIMGTIPSWIIRRGMTVMLIAVAGLIGISALVHYPDMISARITLSTATPPVRIFARTSGKITHLLVANHSAVNNGEYLAVIENPANARSVFELEQKLQSTAPDQLRNTQWPAFSDLGDLQGLYSSFIMALENDQFYQSSGDYRSSQQKILEDQTQALVAMNANLEAQLQLCAREVAITTDQYKAAETLFSEGAISRVDLETKEAAKLQKAMVEKQLRTQIFQNEIQIGEYQRKLFDLRQGHRQTDFSLSMGQTEALRKLEAGIDNWKQNYLLTAPQGGSVEFLDIWAENQYVKAGTEVMSIVPHEDEILGRALVSAFNAGKIRVGQEVNIKLDNYDYREFGMLTGTVKNISSLAREGQYVADITLNAGLSTTHHKKIRFQSEMYGQAEIITQNISLLERLLFRFRELTSPRAPLNNG